MASPRSTLLLCALAASACQPSFGAPLSLVDAPRLLAVRAEPPEAPPGATVMLTSLVASPEGTVATPALDWSLCLSPKPSTENDVVNAACLEAGGVTPFASRSPSASVTLPVDACRWFGPDVPPRMSGQPPFAPRAPDASGGYYQPIRVDLEAASSLELERIRCNPAGASMDLATQLQMQYTPNQNPQLTPLAAVVAGQPIALDAIPAGATVTFTVGWTPSSPQSYPVIDTLAQVLVSHREAMDVSWYATAGAFRDERTGRAETDVQLDTSNTWSAPATSGTVRVWLVLRDSRGGLDFAAQDLTIAASPARP